MDDKLKELRARQQQRDQASARRRRVNVPRRTGHVRSGKKDEDEDPAQQLERILRIDELLAFLGISKAQLWKKIKQGEIPGPVKLTASGRAIGWVESEIIKHQRERIDARDAAAGAPDATAS